LIHQIAMHAVIARPHVRQRLEQLLAQYCAGFSPDTEALRDKLAGLDVGDMSQLQDALNDPRELLAAMQTPAQLQTLEQIQAIVVAIVGYVDDVVATVAPKLMSSSSMINEALRRKRTTESEGRRFVERLLGVELERAQYERGQRFVEGVRERDADSLALLWRGERYLPTPAEVDAPGLWLARLEIENN
jgi:putative hydrolase